MSIQNNFPAIRPSLNLDFANTKELDPRITFTRASTASYYGTRTAKAEENLFVRSEEFDNAIWTKVSVTVSANTVDTNAPNGTATADKITESASGTNQASLNQGSISFVSGLPYTASFFLKQGTETFAQILFSAGAFGVNAYANFNITTGGGALGTVGSSATAVITDAGNGWYRCSVTATATSTASSAAQFNIIGAATAARGESVTLDSGTMYIWGAQLEQRSAATAYTPTTTQAITNYIPVLETAASGVARFDHNPTTFESLGLLVEEQRTNQYLNSHIIINTGVNIATSIGFPALDTTQNFVLGQDNTTTAEHYFQDRSFVPVIGTTYTFSVYAKKGPGSRNLLLRIAGGNIGAIPFDLINGTIIGTAAGVISQAIITPVGNGIYRCSVVWTATAAVSTVFRLQLTLGVNTVYPGDGYSGLYVWGAQLEAGAFPTSYIPTVASQVTRAADSASMTGANFSSWYRADEGALFVDAIGVNNISGATRRFVEIGNSGSTTARLIFGYGTTTSSRLLVVDGGITQADVTITSGIPAGQLVKMAAAYKVNDFQQASNTLTGTQDTSGTVPTASQIILGADNAAVASTNLNGHIRRIAYYPKRLSNSELQGLTS